VDRLSVTDLYVNHTRSEAFSGTVTSTGVLSVVRAGAKDTNIRGVQFDLQVSTGGSGTVPRQVLYVESGATVSRCLVEGVVLLPNSTSLALATQAFLRVTGSFYPCEVRGLRLLPAASAQIPSGVCGVLLGGNVDSSDSVTSCDGVRLRDCFLGEFSGTGIWDNHTSAGTNTIDSCEISNVGYLGVSSNDYPILLGQEAQDTGLGPVRVTNCRVVTSPVVGIRSYRSHVTIHGNHVQNTSNDVSVVPGYQFQIFLGPYFAGHFSGVKLWSVKQNVCVDTANLPLEIGVTIGAASLFRDVHQGFDTYKDSGGSEIFTVGTFETGQPMIFNTANYRTI
jgi:hypothetical protein